MKPLAVTPDPTRRRSRSVWVLGPMCLLALSVVTALAAPASAALRETARTDAGVAICPCSLWPNTARPAVTAASDARKNELGVKFRTDVAGSITGVRFFKASTNTGTHLGHLWSKSGALLASATFTGETSSGWQTVSFAQAVPVAAGTTYVASYYAPDGHYSADYGYFASAGRVSSPLTALAAGVDGANGVYRFGGSGFPKATYSSTNYWVDVVLATTATPPAVPATPTGLTAGAVTTSTAALSWTDGSTETGYRIERSGDGSTGWAAVGSTATDVVTYTDTSLVAATTYYYRVVATNSAGASAPSAVVSTTTAATGAVPCSGVAISAGNDLAATVNAYGSGTTFCLATGMYRITTTIAPKANDVISGQPGTVISGARVLATWTQRGAAWTADGYLPAAYTDSGYNPCQDTSTNLCKLNEWLFRDDVAVRRVASAAAVVPGTFYTDYAANRTYVGDDPSGHLVELSRTKTAITSAATGVTLTGITVEKFATANQRGAILANAANWTIKNSRVRFNHGAGIYSYGDNLRVLNSRVDHNGTLGIGIYLVNGVLVQDSELDHNNTDGSLINDGENGGYKSTNTLNDVLRNNNVHDNMGMGLWFDIDDSGSLIENNTLSDNASDGVRFEISYNGIIRNNTVTGNGLNRQQGDGSLYYGAGIVVSNGNGVEIYGNTLVGNDNSIGAVMQNRGSGIYGTWILANTYFHDNYVTTNRGVSGIMQSVGDTSYFTTRGNRFANNHYVVDALAAPRFTWSNATGGVSFWQGKSQDMTGTFTVGP